MPIRFESPSLGGRGDSYLDPSQWQLDVSYRHLGADEYFVGRERLDERGPGGQPLEFNINSVTVSVSRAFSMRYTLSLHVPWSTGTTSRIYADGRRHETSASGLGDMRLVSTMWLWHPLDAPRGNIAIGLGAKAPTGTHTATDYNWLANGDSTIAPVDQAVQLGDGGWGIIMSADAFRRIRDRTFVYAAAEYLATTREKTEVASPRGGQQLMGVPDVYSVRAGATHVVAPNLGVTLGLGMRQDATTRADLIGGRDDSFRRPAVVGYVDPGLSITRNNNTFYLNTPIRAYQNFRLDYSYKPGDRAAGGDLARYLIFMGYSRRW